MSRRIQKGSKHAEGDEEERGAGKARRAKGDACLHEARTHRSCQRRGGGRRSEGLAIRGARGRQGAASEEAVNSSVDGGRGFDRRRSSANGAVGKGRAAAKDG